jgi:hypothetical protein
MITARIPQGASVMTNTSVTLQNADIADVIDSGGPYDSVQGMQHLPASFTPGLRLGAGLDETIEAVQRARDEQNLAEPVTVRKANAKI